MLALQRLSLVLFIGCVAVPVSAQCGTRWLPGQAIPGVYGDVESATAWDPDGSGPASERLVIGGDFYSVGALSARSLAVYDPVTDVWSNIGDVDGDVFHVSALSNGDLLVAGALRSIGGVAVTNIARWDGSAWSGVGAGVARAVNCVVELPNGDLVAGGFGGLERFDGTTWAPFGNANGAVTAVAATATGGLAVAGFFTRIGGLAAPRLAWWDGVAWSPMGSGLGLNGSNDGIVEDLIVLPSGVLVAGGKFLTSGGQRVRYLASWTGGAWSQFGGGLTPTMPSNSKIVCDLALTPTGDLLVAGYFRGAGGVQAQGVAIFGQGGWSGLGAGVAGVVTAVTAMASGDIVMGGTSRPFTGTAVTSPNGSDAVGLAAFDGSSWRALASGQGLSGQISAIAVDRAGEVFIGGSFGPVAGGTHSLARWSGAGWSPVVTPLATVRALLPLGNGGFVVGGTAPLQTERVGIWDGASWTPMGNGLRSNTGGHGVEVLHRRPNGDLVAGGSFSQPGWGVVRWDGAAWQNVGRGLRGTVHDFAELPSGELLAAGAFTHTGVGTPAPSLAVWDGTAWQAFPGGSPNLRCLAVEVLPGGDVIVGGAPGTSGIRRWDGTSWSSPGGGTDHGVSDLQVLPGGRLLAVGAFASAGSTAAERVAVWNGTQWAAVGTGVTGPGSVEVAALLPDGTVAVGGYFAYAGDMVSSTFARFASTCPASVTSIPSLCQGPAGGMDLRSIRAPWLGSTFAARTGGFASNSLGLAVTGLISQTTPLPQVHPAAGPNCDLLTSIDLVDLLIPVAGFADSRLSVPDDPAIAGLVMRHQILQIELGRGLALASLSVSNALELTLGSF